MHSLKKHSKISLFSLFAPFAFASCLSNAAKTMPQFTKNIELVSREVMSIGNFKEVRFQGSSEQTNFDKPQIELEIRLVDGEIHSYSNHALDSLAKVIAHVARKNIKNWETYEWATIIFATSDGSVPSDSSNKSVFVYRPQEIK